MRVNFSPCLLGVFLLAFTCRLSAQVDDPPLPVESSPPSAKDTTFPLTDEEKLDDIRKALSRINTNLDSFATKDQFLSEIRRLEKAISDLEQRLPVAEGARTGLATPQPPTGPAQYQPASSPPQTYYSPGTAMTVTNRMSISCTIKINSFPYFMVPGETITIGNLSGRTVTTELVGHEALRTWVIPESGLPPFFLAPRSK